MTTQTQIKNDAVIVKLATIDNGKILLDRNTRKPIDAIGKHVNKVVSDIIGIDNKSNTTRSKLEYDLFKSDTELMNTDFNVFNDTKTNNNKTTNKKANVRNVPTKLQSELRKLTYNSDTVAYLEKNGSFIRAVGNLITMNTPTELNEMIKVNGLTFDDKTKSFSLISNGHVVNYKTVYTYNGVAVDHKNKTATVKKVGGHLPKTATPKKSNTVDRSKDVKIELSLKALEAMTLDELRAKALEFTAYFGASFHTKKANVQKELTTIATQTTASINEMVLLAEKKQLNVCYKGNTKK